MKIEATGNTKEQAENALENKRADLKAQANIGMSNEIRDSGEYEPALGLSSAKNLAKV